MTSNTLEQQQQKINSVSRKSSIDRIEMMRFLEQLIQDEDQQKYQQSLQQYGNTAEINNISNHNNIFPKSADNTPTPFNNSILPRRSFSRGESAISVSKTQRESTLSNIYEEDSLNNLVINFQYSNASHSIRLMDDERDRLRELIQHDKENVNIPPMFMQRHMEQKQSSINEKTKNGMIRKRRYSNISISNVTPEPEEVIRKPIASSLNGDDLEDNSEVLEFNDLDIDLQNFKEELNKPTPPVSSVASPKLVSDQKVKIKKLNDTVSSLTKEITSKDKQIADLILKEKTAIKENNLKISKMQKTESMLTLQIKKDKNLIKKLIKEVVLKDKINLELAQEMKQYKNSNNNNNTCSSNLLQDKKE